MFVAYSNLNLVQDEEVTAGNYFMFKVVTTPPGPLQSILYHYVNVEAAHQKIHDLMCFQIVLT